jgi:hypothetical protein
MTEPQVHSEIKPAANNSLKRAMLYMPLVLIFAGLGAVAMFPEQSMQYAGPIVKPLLIGKSCPRACGSQAMARRSFDCPCDLQRTEIGHVAPRNVNEALSDADEAAYFETGVSSFTSQADPFFTN